MKRGDARLKRIGCRHCLPGIRTQACAVCSAMPKPFYARYGKCKHLRGSIRILYTKKQGGEKSPPCFLEQMTGIRTQACATCCAMPTIIFRTLWQMQAFAGFDSYSERKETGEGHAPPVSFGADDGNRTRVFGLGSGHSAIELHLPAFIALLL